MLTSPLRAYLAVTAVVSCGAPAAQCPGPVGGGTSGRRGLELGDVRGEGPVITVRALEHRDPVAPELVGGRQHDAGAGLDRAGRHGIHVRHVDVEAVAV